jgi:hypothetical protein
MRDGHFPTGRLAELTDILRDLEAPVIDEKQDKTSPPQLGLSIQTLLQRRYATGAR